MGSLSSRPKVPTPQIVTLPQTGSTAPQPQASTVSTDANDQAETTQQTREDNLLRRQRGRSSTIITGFRGLVSNGNASQQKKTLLGE